MRVARLRRRTEMTRGRCSARALLDVLLLVEKYRRRLWDVGCMQMMLWWGRKK